ncbi:DsbA family protein [Nitrosomonas sp. Nm33]|uniref:DsbA family protein n=1 Tax=Nitrosomonas sp. Nm33 TaxID=133724 RepID=UPI0008967FD4|nr:DsbA family protein [Nitrosomonas sp. Nm33]SDY96210.1 putative protein-disulfide isomerase [Nitrosomonas sp. Nm33]
MNGRTLWYIADPMCSWCWGFSPVIEAIRHEYGERLAIKLVVGGLRPGTTEPLATEKRAEILHHWHNVQRITGQSFTFEGALPEGFIYDTEPACRAVVSASLIDSSYTFPLLAAIQHVFYVEQANVTQTDTLTQLAAVVGIPATQFSQVFASDAAKQATQQHFHQAIQWGVRGFPTVIGQDVAGLHLLTNGYCTIETMRQRIDAWLNTAIG